MNRTLLLPAAVAAALALCATSSFAAPHPTLVVTMTNDPAANQIKVYDASTHVLLQTLATNGQGGVGGNARGVRQIGDKLVAVVNHGSGTVAVFRREDDRLQLDRVVSTSSAPVSIDFGNGHMYVAGDSTVDSFRLNGNHVGGRDGSAGLVLAGAGAPPPGSTAQVGVLDDKALLVTLKTDPTPGTVDTVALHDGAVTGVPPTAVSAPAGTLTPFGFDVYPDGSAVITLAHSSNDGLFRDGAFTSIINAGQGAPCWMVRSGKYMFSVNAASHSVSRLIGSGKNIFVDDPVAANISTGATTDVDAAGGSMGVIDHSAGASHLTLFSMNEFGELSSQATVDVGVPNANGVAIMSAAEDDSGE